MVGNNIVLAGHMKDPDVQVAVNNDVNRVTKERVVTQSSMKTAEDVDCVLTVGEEYDFGVRSGME